jgi:hypothetical protein
MKFRTDIEAKAIIYVNREALSRAVRDSLSLHPNASYRPRYRQMYARQVVSAKRQIMAATEYLERADHGLG